MEWVEVFPAFRITMEAVQGRFTYLALMNLSILLLIALPIVLFLVTPRVRTAVKLSVTVGAALVALVLGAGLFYYTLFTDFGLITTEVLGNVLDFFARSLVGFAFFYCVGVPVLVGFAAFLVARSVEVVLQAIRHPKETNDIG